MSNVKPATDEQVERAKQRCEMIERDGGWEDESGIWCASKDGGDMLPLIYRIESDRAENERLREWADLTVALLKRIVDGDSITEDTLNNAEYLIAKLRIAGGKDEKE